MRIRTLILALLGTIGAVQLLDAQYIRIGNAEAIPNWLALGTSMARGSKVSRRIKSILEGRVGLARSMRGFSWAIMLAVAVPAVYGASAFQLTSVLKTPPSPYASMSQSDGYRAILADGWTLTSDGAAKLESDLKRDPENLAARIRLLSYYTQYMALPELRSKHLLWLIEHPPRFGCFPAKL